MAVNVVPGDPIGDVPSVPMSLSLTGNRSVQPAQRPLFVREAQRALRDLGYDPGPIDGTCGSRMRAALEKYQLAERLPVTGELDAPTMERLDVYRRLFRPAREV
jgi:peptidoglycan hydrolase-like protein with peptidoglycan-binding domain